MIINKGLAALSDEAAHQMSLAESLIDSSRLAEAVAIYDDVIAHEPTSYVLAKRGFAKFESKNYDEAIEDFDRAILLKPNSPVTLAYRARAKEFKEDLDGAVQDYRASLIYRTRAEIYCDIAMIFEYQGKFKDAIAEFNKAIELEPDNELAINSIQRLEAAQAEIDNSPRLTNKPR